MPIFSYKAVATSGEVLDGNMEARNQAAVIERLQGMGHLPIRVQEADNGGTAPTQREAALFQRRGVSRNEVMEFTRELATLLHAGLPLDRCLEIMVGMAANPRVSELLARVQADVRGGASLSGLMPFASVFPFMPIASAMARTPPGYSLASA